MKNTYMLNSRKRKNKGLLSENIALKRENDDLRGQIIDLTKSFSERIKKATEPFEEQIEGYKRKIRVLMIGLMGCAKVWQE